VEDENAPSFFSMEPCFFYDTNQRFGFSVTVDIARAEAVDGIGQSEVVEVVERVVGLSECERKASP
jgi:hypothetical protein